jgi:hypothetical protein
LIKKHQKDILVLIHSKGIRKREGIIQNPDPIRETIVQEEMKNTTMKDTKIRKRNIGRGEIMSLMENEE